ncbi:putative membrane protein YeaQ/YmgE (transglycosylase-associated protein family) [Archangium gephyra]|uniref:Membrane protein n=1 Tax=Archangium gephyra TaxID=48 RepID=A0AAC8Q2B4_9BACT|nr:GlsB/YeaQ/YmgE family stress response membrane protein [Archangium gephyra]AKI99481.1 putative membrane protein [Archangium gephyra]REG27974.1 putative membrane protein YeaQ/YmgE (transglycosylase-associated protein family) [Archangium gephyra]
MYNLCGWIIMGLIAGLIARALMPGRQSMGFIGTTLLGIAGSFMGGFLASIIAGHGWRGPQSTGYIGSILGAIVLLWLSRMLSGR